MKFHLLLSEIYSILLVDSNIAQCNSCIDKQNHVEQIEGVPYFMLSSLPLSEKIHLAIKDMGFTEATPIQEQAVPYALDGRDIIGQAQTGTGKTAAFAIPILQRIDTEDRRTQAIIMCPTRELAMQITEEFKKLSKYMPEIEPLAVYGGQPIDIQLRALRRCPQIVIGTPGRIMDHIRRKTLDLSNIKIVTLDEADEMLDMGFRDDIKTILESVPTERQTLLFSATMPRSIMDLAKQYLVDPVHIKTITKNMTVSAIEQIYLEVKERNKLEVMTRLVDQFSPKLSLVFCNTKKKVDEVVENMIKLGYKAEGLHGDLRQSQRDAIMNKFRSGNVELLVATDVAARGLDVDDIEIVFNYDIPQDAEYYTHRIGRTGRAGKVGKSYTFVTGREIYRIKDIIRITKSDIKLGVIPSKKDVDAKKAKLYIDKILEELQKEQDLAPYYEYIAALETDGIDLKDFLATLLKMNLFSQKKVDLFNEIEDSSKALPTSSYQFRSQEDRRSDYKREHRFQPSDRFGENDRPRRDFSSPSTNPRGGSSGPYRDRPSAPRSNSDSFIPRQKPEYTRPRSDSDVPMKTPGYGSTTAPVRENSLVKQSFDTLVKPNQSSGPSNPYRDRADKKSGYVSKFSDRPKYDSSSKPSYNYPKKAKIETPSTVLPSGEEKKKKYIPKKKTIYNGPDVPRVTVYEK